MNYTGKTKYRTVRIPEGLVLTIKDLIIDFNDLGYRSHSEFIIEAVRRRIEEVSELHLNSHKKEKKII